jgi:hypothetical protein
MNHLPPSPENNIRVISIFFRKFAEIFAREAAPPVSTTQIGKFATGTTGVVDTGGKFSNGVNNTGGI